MSSEEISKNEVLALRTEINELKIKHKDYNCTVCEKSFRKKHSFDRHNLSVMHLRRAENRDMKRHYCKCGKYYAHAQSLYNHKEKCSNIPNQLEVKTKEITRLQTENQTTLKTIEEQNKEIVRLKKDRGTLKTIEERNKEIVRLKKDKDELRNQLSLLLEMDTITTIEEQSKEIVRLKKEITKFKQERISGKTLYQKRLKLTSNERELIADSQKSQCKLCESALPEYYHIDHIIALQFGGSNAFDNLQAICAGCHNHKTILETKNAKRIKEAIYGIIYPSETT